MVFTRRDYDFLYGETPREGERALYNLGFSPREIGFRGFKDLDIAGIALEFAKFEKLYDINYQQYQWLYSTGYGSALYDILVDLIASEYPDDDDRFGLISLAISRARKTLD